MVEGAGGLTRGEIWTVAGGADYAGKPRPGQPNQRVVLFLGLTE
jgi:hypothetical protein